MGVLKRMRITPETMQANADLLHKQIMQLFTNYLAELTTATPGGLSTPGERLNGGLNGICMGIQVAENRHRELAGASSDKFNRLLYKLKDILIDEGILDS